MPPPLVRGAGDAQPSTRHTPGTANLSIPETDSGDKNYEPQG